MASAQPAVRIDSLEKRYASGTLALKGVSFDVEEGEFFGQRFRLDQDGPRHRVADGVTENHGVARTGTDDDKRLGGGSSHGESPRKW